MIKKEQFFVSILFLLVGFLLGRALPSTTPTSMIPDTMHDHQDHGVIEVEGEENNPTISIEPIEQSDDSLDVRITTSNFLFAPENVGKDHHAGEGHALLYINHQKVTRFYGQWVHISQENLSLGTNHVCVSLNSNNHSHYTIDGEIIEDCITIMKQ